MSDLHECATCHARAMLADVYAEGGAILFKSEAINAGLVQDVTAGKWYPLVHDDEGDYCFIDNAHEHNYAGAKGSTVYKTMPTATLTCPF